MKVEYIEHMGCDLSVVRAARVSFDKESTEFTFRKDKAKGSDEGLIEYLAKNNHWTPFAHPQITLRVTVPIFIANQIKRHQVGFALNEVSRRYVDSEPEFYLPDEWRGRPTGYIKQGSSDKVIDTIVYMKGCFDGGLPAFLENVEYTNYKDHGSCDQCGDNSWSAEYSVEDMVNEYQNQGKELYTFLIDNGIAPEQARMILPQSMYTSWYWTGSLYGYARLCHQRLDNHAQKESQMIAQQISDIIEPLFPVSWKVLVKDKINDKD